MLFFMGKTRKGSMTGLGLVPLTVAALTLVLFSGITFAAEAKQALPQKGFASPEEAVTAFVTAVKTGDLAELSAILGPDGKEIISSGDEVADKNGREHFVHIYDEKNELTRQGDDRAVLQVGKDGWPLPIPIVKVGGAWRFDTKDGKQEILNRRIGKNELSAIQACLAYYDAQRDYALASRDGKDLPEYAQKFFSEPGKKDGLYWETREGEPESPLGPLFAAAQEKGYTRRQAGQRPAPYLGYYYRILTAQGKNAPGGAYSYLAKGRMVGGFALVAYPAEYGASGIMTFLVSHDGVVYEKDLGRKTEAVVSAMKTFDPDNSWQKVDPKYLEAHRQGG